MNIGQTVAQKAARAGILAMALLACALLATACSAGGSTSSSSTGSPGSSSANTNSPSASAVASQASSASAKDAIEISNAKLEQDAIGRYVLTATVSNSGNESLDVKLDGKASLTKREKNKYNEEEEFTSIEKISGYESVTPWVSGGDSITILGLKAGEKRELTIYPTSIGGILSQTNNTASEPELIVSNVSPTAEASKLSDVPDFDTNLKVEITSFDGKKVSGTVTNNTGKYLNSASLTFTKWDSSNLPITSKPMRDQRPIGADLKTEVVKNLKPGATAEFNVVLGDCDTVKLKDVYYDVDQAKS